MGDAVNEYGVGVLVCVLLCVYEVCSLVSVYTFGGGGGCKQRIHYYFMYTHIKLLITVIA